MYELMGFYILLLSRHVFGGGREARGGGGHHNPLRFNDLKGKFGNKKNLPLFKSISENNKNPSQEFPEFFLKGGFTIISPVAVQINRFCLKSIYFLRYRSEIVSSTGKATLGISRSVILQRLFWSSTNIEFLESKPDCNRGRINAGRARTCTYHFTSQCSSKNYAFGIDLMYLQNF